MRHDGKRIRDLMGVALCALLLALSYSAEAQQAKVAKIGFLGTRPASGSEAEPGSPEARGASMRLGNESVRRILREFGYVEGQNIAFEYRSAENKLDRLPALADELVRLKVNLLFTPGINEALAAKNATSTIPIVFSTTADPVAAGLVDSLARPGGNITGFTYIGA